MSIQNSKMPRRVSKRKLGEMAMHPLSSAVPKFAMSLRLNPNMLASLESLAQRDEISNITIQFGESGNSDVKIRINDQSYDVRRLSEKSTVQIYRAVEKGSALEQYAEVRSKLLVSSELNEASKRDMRTRTDDARAARLLPTVKLLDQAETDEIAKLIPHKPRVEPIVTKETKDIYRVEPIVTKGKIKDTSLVDAKIDSEYLRFAEPHNLIVKLSGIFQRADYKDYWSEICEFFNHVQLRKDSVRVLVGIQNGELKLEKCLYVKFDSYEEYKLARCRDGEPLDRAGVSRDNRPHIGVESCSPRQAGDVDKHGLWLSPGVSPNQILDSIVPLVHIEQLLHYKNVQTCLSFDIEGTIIKARKVSECDTISEINSAISRLENAMDSIEKETLVMRILDFENDHIEGFEQCVLAQRVLMRLHFEIQQKVWDLKRACIPHYTRNFVK